MPALTLASARQVIHDLRSRLLSKPSPDEVQILGMSLGKIEEIVSKVDRSKPGTPILDALTKEYSRQEVEREAKSTTAKTMPTKPQAALPAKPIAPAKPAATVQPAPRPAINPHAGLAAAILDETDRRNAAAKIKSLAEFKKLSPREASAFCRNGGKITN